MTGARARLARAAGALALIAASFALYGRSLSYPPIWDDHAFVVDQPFLKDPRALKVLLDPRRFLRVLPVANAARPVWLASVLADRAAGGGGFAILRASNLFWCGAGAVVLSALAWELTADAAASWAAGLLFAVHPTHAEVAEIVAFRSDALAFFFGTLALLLYVRSRRSARSAAWIAAALAAFALALLSKESAVAVFPLLAVVDLVIAPEKSIRRRAAVYGAFAVVLSAYLYYRAPRAGYESAAGRDAFTAAFESVPAAFSPVSRVDPSDQAYVAARNDRGGRTRDPRPWDDDFKNAGTRWRTLVAVQGSSLRRLWWPTRLQGDYCPAPARSWADAGFLSALASWALLLTVAIWSRRRVPTVTAGLWWIAAALLPVSGIVTMRNLTADRYLYFASAGVCLAAAGLVGASLPRRRAALAACAVVAGFWGFLVVERLPAFSSDRSFYAATVAVDPGVARARYNLGLAQWSAGDEVDAEENLRAAARLWPQSERVKAGLDAFLARPRAAKP